MKEQIAFGEIFQSVNFNEKHFQIGEYDECTFIHCDFSGVDLSSSVFTDCVFTGCNFSMSKLNGTSFSKVKFMDCKMIGIHFETCNPFMFTVFFKHCILDLSSFHGMKIPAIQYVHCSMREADLTDTNLTGAIFTGSDLYMTVFQQTNLEKADLSEAHHFHINPVANKVKKAKFSREGLEGLLVGFDIKIVE
jgi:uncharacterized protein YjbI with pentapeptide repeats